MIIDLSYKQLDDLMKKLEELPDDKIKKFILLMPKVGLILDWLKLAMLGLDYKEIYKEMLIIHKDDKRVLNIINEAIQGNIYYREK